MKNVINDIETGSLLQQASENEKLNQYQVAIAFYEAAISSNETNFAAYISLGALYEKVFDENNAINTYKKGINKARTFQNKKAEKEISYTLLGLMD